MDAEEAMKQFERQTLWDKATLDSIVNNVVYAAFIRPLPEITLMYWKGSIPKRK